MIHVKLGNRTLGITFQYEVIKPSLENPDAVRRTWCEIHRLGPPVTDKDGKVHYQTEAIVARAGGRCSPSEPGGFNYEKGRKLGLARALKSYGLTRPERTKVWHAYLGRPRPKSVQLVKVQPADVHLTEPLATLTIPDFVEGMKQVIDQREAPDDQQADGFKEPHGPRQLLLRDRADVDWPTHLIHSLDLNAGEAH